MFETLDFTFLFVLISSAVKVAVDITDLLIFLWTIESPEITSMFLPFAALYL